MPHKQGRGPSVLLLSVLGVGALSLLSRLPLGLLTAAGARLGGLYYHLDRRRKRIGLSNMRRALGGEKSPEELRDLLKSVYRNMGRSLLEFAAMPRLSREKVRSLIRFEGLENLEAARREGKGVILLNGHLGNWELYAQALAVSGYPLHVIGRRANVGLLHDYMMRARESHGNRVVVRGEKAMRRILSILRQGEILGVMGDQRGSTSRGILIDFLGRPAPTDRTLARIMLKTGAAVLVGFGVRNPDGTHTVRIGTPLQIRRSSDPEADAARLTEQYLRAYEAIIRQYPDQWLWMHRRWMRRNPPIEA